MLHRTSCAWLAFALTGAAALSVEAAAPALSGTTPRGGQRGVEVEVTLSGARLTDAQEVMFYEPGIAVTKLEVVNDGAVKATFNIAPDCQLGAHRLRIRTATGLSDLRSFMVGALPQVEEKEPNSDFAEPQPIPMNVTVNGVANNEDVDYYVVEAKKGDRITAEVEGIRLGITMFDVYVAIMNEARFELSASDDAALVWQDGIASVVAPEDGKYIIQVRESAYAGNGACLYRVHIGHFPRPMATVPAGGPMGQQVAVKFLGDAAGEAEQVFQLPGELDEKYAIFRNDDKGIAPSPNRFRITDFGNVNEQEPNETHATATPFTAPMALNGVVSSPTDLDFYKFPAKKGEVYDVRVFARNIRSPLDPVLYIFNAANGGTIAGNDDSAGPDSFIRFTVPADGEYIIHVVDHLKNGGPTYFYRIELSPVRPKVTLSLAEFVQYVQPTVTVPKGNRFAVMVNAARADFGGALQLWAESLPAGVTMECPGMLANMTTVPVIFHATPEAANAGALVDLKAKCVNEQGVQIAEGRLIQDVTLVRGQNNNPFYTESVPRLATSVADEAPFTVTIVEPKVPIVQNGVMNLKVVATRKEGFTAPIKVDLLYFPPGINASRSISVEEGKLEALIPINAAGNAGVAEWPLVVTGQATVGNGPIMVASPFAKLRIAEQYLTFAYEAAAVEQGQETELVIKLNKAKDFEGTAEVTLIGLPAKAVTMPAQVTKDTAELVFKIKTEKETPAGNHKNLFCTVTVMENGEPVVHNLGTGALRVDVPLPPKKDAPPPMPAATPAQPAPPKPADAPPMKRLTRLEQLRLEQAEREKTEKKP